MQHISKTTSLYYAVYNGYIVFGDHPPKSKKIKPEVANLATKKSKQQVSKKGKSSHEIQKKNYNKEENANRVHHPLVQKNSSTGNNKLSSTLPKKETISNIKEDNRVVLQKPVNKISDSAVSKSQKTDSVIKSIDKPAVAKKIDTTTSDQNQATKSKSQSSINKKNIFSGLHYGAEWSFAFPFTGFKDYFTGPGANPQPYYLLIPALWFSKELGEKSELSLQVKFMQQYYAGNQVLKDTTMISSGIDSASIQKSLLLSKIFGTCIGLQYNYHISEKISIGAGVMFYWQNSAVTHLQTKVQTANSKSVSDSAFGIKKSSAEWRYMKSSAVIGKIEVLYNMRKINIGASLSVPVSGFSETNTTISKALNLQAIFRYRIN